MRRDWKDFLSEVLKESPTPVVQTCTDSEESLVCASNLWTLALDRRHQLRKAGVRPGDVVVCHTVGIPMLIELVAAAVGEFIFVPVHDPSTYLTNKSKKLLPDDKSMWVLPAPGSPIVNAGIIPLDWAPIVQNSSVVMLLATSGTTSGKPKIVGLTAQGLIHQLQTHQAALSLERDAVRLCLLPRWHAFGLVLDMLLGLVARQIVLLRDHVSPANPALRVLRRAVEEFDVRHVALVPRMLDVVLKQCQLDGRYAEKFRRLHVHVGGARVPENLSRRAREVFERLIVGYGLTECGPGVLLDGEPIGCDVKVDPDSSEILVRTSSMGVFDGQASRENTVLLDNFFRTGDIGRDLNGRIDVIGRMDEALKTSDGLWTSLSQVEESVCKKFQVERCAFVPRISSDEATLILVVPEDLSIEHQKVSDYISKVAGFSPTVEMVAPAAVDEQTVTGLAKSPSDVVRMWALSRNSG